MAYPLHVNFISDWWKEQVQGTVRRISAVKVYYIYRGRNAWHSTWVENYFGNCLQPSLQAAKDQAEQMRTQGSVFSIIEKPALLIESESHVALITQLNSVDPLKDYRPVLPMRPDRPAHWHDVRGLGRLRSLLRRGADLTDVIQSFAPYGFFWSTPPVLSPSRNEVAIEVGPPALPGWEKLDGDCVRWWRSEVYESRYRLSWSEATRSPSGAASRNLAAGGMRRSIVDRRGLIAASE